MNQNLSKSYFSAPILHLLAHSAIIYAILGFHSRSGGGLIHPIPLNAYIVFVAITLFYVLWQFFKNTTPNLLTLYIPQILGFILARAFHFTPNFGGAKFTPANFFEDDEITFIFYLLYFIVSAFLALVLGKRLFKKFVGISATILGGFNTWILWTHLPQNGTGFHWTSLTVPENAWDWSYSFTTTSILMATLVPMIIAAAVAAYNSVPERIA